MKFYNRENEIQVLLKKIHSNNFEFIYLLGKRRVWKTELIKHLNNSILKKDFYYIFVEKSDLIVFLQKQEEYIYEKTWLKYKFENIEDFLDFFFLQSDLNLIVIDEFQNFNSIDKSIFSIFQKKIDEYQNKSNKKIIVLGSLQSLMIKIFENSNEPLYKRSTFNLFIKEFDLDTQIQILKDIFKENYTHQILLDIYSIFGWTPYYLKSIYRENYDKYELKQLLKDLFFDEFAIFKNEWKEILIEEFGMKYKRFFAILQAISIWKNKRNEIISQVWLWSWEIDLYLRELIDIYDIIQVDYPVLEKQKNISKYKIKDNFINFRFKYVYWNKDKLELWLYDLVLENTLKDFEKYKWFKFEKLLKDFLILENKKGNLDFVFSKIGTWLNRKNNEIDIIYTDEKENIVFLECKINKNRINQSEINQLKLNVSLFLDKNPYFTDKNIKIWFAVFDIENILEINFI